MTTRTQAATDDEDFCGIIRKVILPSPVITTEKKINENVIQKSDPYSADHYYKQYDIADCLNRHFNGQVINKTAIIQKIFDTVQTLRVGLIVVDFQNDFVHGSLSIKNGQAQQDPDEAVEPLNGILSRFKDFQVVVYTMDWHPFNHISFLDHCHDSDRRLSSKDAGTAMFNLGDIVTFNNPPMEQGLYPAHCVKDSWGAEIYSKLLRVEGAKYIRKGTKPFSESYSGFVDNMGENRTDLEDFLRQNAIQAVFICGLAFDICVAWTARDAAKLGFLTAVIGDCSKGLSREGIKRTKKEFAELGVPIVTSSEVHQFIDQRQIPWQWFDKLLTMKITNDCGESKT